MRREANRGTEEQRNRGTEEQEEQRNRARASQHILVSASPHILVSSPDIPARFLRRHRAPLSERGVAHPRVLRSSRSAPAPSSVIEERAADHHWARRGDRPPRPRQPLTIPSDSRRAAPARRRRPRAMFQSHTSPRRGDDAQHRFSVPRIRRVAFARPSTRPSMAEARYNERVVRTTHTASRARRRFRHPSPATDPTRRPSLASIVRDGVAICARSREADKGPYVRRRRENIPPRVKHRRRHRRGDEKIDERNRVRRASHDDVVTQSKHTRVRTFAINAWPTSRHAGRHRWETFVCPARRVPAPETRDAFMRPGEDGGADATPTRSTTRHGAPSANRAAPRKPTLKRPARAWRLSSTASSRWALDAGGRGHRSVTVTIREDARATCDASTRHGSLLPSTDEAAWDAGRGDERRSESRGSAAASRSLPRRLRPSTFIRWCTAPTAGSPSAGPGRGARRTPAAIAEAQGIRDPRMRRRARARFGDDAGGKISARVVRVGVARCRPSAAAR